MEENKQKLTNVYEEYSDALFRYCFFKVSNREKALDLVQETFTRTWQYLQKGNLIENVKPFLYTTVRHLIVDEYRKKKILSLDTLMDQGLEPNINNIEEELYMSIDASSVMEYVYKLPEVYSSIIIMRYINDFSVQDIARIVNKSENVISVRIHRGMSKLRLLVPN